jgi:hypothetical protein
MVRSTKRAALRQVPGCCRLAAAKPLKARGKKILDGVRSAQRRSDRRKKSCSTQLSEEKKFVALSGLTR